MTREDKLRMAQQVREGMVIDPVIPEDYRKYQDMVTVQERYIPTSEGDSHVYVIRESGRTEILPLYVNVHGGGFVRPHMDRDLMFSEMVTCETGCVTLDIDYRLAPEYPYPISVNECYDVIKWAHDNAAELGIDPQSIIVGGHSSGGTLTAALALMAGERQEFPIKLQILDYPALDMYTDPADKERIENDVIDVDRARAYNSLYFDDESCAAEPLASPVYATEDMLRHLPQALIITAGKDTLKFEAARYADNLKKAGVSVTQRCFEESRHGFMTHCRDEYRDGHKLYIDTMKRVLSH